MNPLFETVTDLAFGVDTLRRRRYGVIEVRHGRLVAVRLRPFPKLLSLPEVYPVRWRYHGRGPADRCLLYYNQPWRHHQFLSLKYVVSTAGATLATFRRALDTLDEIARIKQSDALLCDAANLRISDRLLARWGWRPHCPRRWHRNFIKRFYGEYPAVEVEQLSEEGMAELAAP